MINVSRLLYGCLLLNALAVYAADPVVAETIDGDELIEQIESLVKVSNEVRGSFHQDKYISVLPQPLKSSGAFSYSSQHGLQWQTLQPIASELVFNEQGIAQQVDGHTLWQIEPDQPITIALTRVLSGVLAADWQVLQNYFAMSGAIEGETWRVTLEPREVTWQQVVTQLEVRGDDAVQSLIMIEPNSDRTEIYFDIEQSDKN